MAVRVSSDGAAWRQYLTASSYLYKYESYEQLLIYGFKPNCTAVADPATWKRLGYSPRQDIPVTPIRLPGGRTLYDVSDLVQTGEQQPIRLWTPAGHEQAVASQLKTAYQIPDDNSLDEAISGAVMSELDRYLDMNAAAFEEHFGPNMDDGQLTLQILAATLYTVYHRCGIREPFPTSLEAVLDEIHRYQNPDLITLINHAVWQCTGTVLRQIERTVQQERSRTQNPSPRNRRRQRSRQAAQQREISGQIGIENIPDEQIILPPEAGRRIPEKGAGPKTDSQVQQEKKAAPAQEANQAPELPAAPPPGWKSTSGNRYEVWPQADHRSPYGIWDTETEKFVMIKDLPIMFYHREHAEIFMQGMERQEHERQQQQAQQETDEETHSSTQQKAAEPPHAPEVQQSDMDVPTSGKQPDDTSERAESAPDDGEKGPEPEQALPQQTAPLSRKEIQAAIEAAIQEWNGSNDSKHNVVRYMRVHGNEEEAAQWLQQEYGDNLPRFPVPAAHRDITWNRVRRYADKLIREDRFFTDAEKDALEDIDPVEMRERLAQRGIVDGQVVDEERLMNDPFILQVQQDVALASVAHDEDSPERNDVNTQESSDQVSIQDYQKHMEDEYTSSENDEPDTLEVEITFSEHPAFYKKERVNGEVVFTDRYNHLSFALANRLFAELDRKQQIDREEPDSHAGWYHKTDFVIHAKMNGIEYNYDGRYDLGDGDGTLIDYIRAFHEYASRELSKEWKSQGTYEENMASLHWGQQTFIPYLEQHTELSHEDELLLTEIMATAPEWYAAPQDVTVLPVEATVLSAPGVSSAVVDEVLRLGSNHRDSVLRIIGRHQRLTENFADFLKQEFWSTHSGGRGVIIDGQKYSVWYNEQGIYIAPGNRVFRHTPSVLSTEPEGCFRWEQVAARIDALIKAGRYAPQELVDKALDFQHRLAAQSLWYMHQDVSDEVEFFMDADLFKGGFPDSTEQIAQKLSDAAFLASTITGLEAFREQYLENRSIMRWKQYNPIAVLPQILLLQNAPQIYPSSVVITDRPGSFITEDEIDACVRTGSGEHFNLEQYSFIIQGHSIQEIAANLKRSYGTGGASHSVSGAANSWTDYSSKGFVLKRDDVQIKFTWETLAKHMRDMVLSGTFLNAGAQEKMPEYERYILARETYSFFSAAATLTSYPYERTGDYYKDEPQIQELLKSPESVNRLASSMRQALNETDVDLEQFKQLAGNAADIESYANGTYSLFTPCKEIQEEALVHGTELYVPVIQPEAQSIDEGLSTINSERLDVYPQDVVPNPVHSVESTIEQEPLYHVGDSVYLDDKEFIIEDISQTTGEVQLRDPLMAYPIYRAESQLHFIELLRRNKRNTKFTDFYYYDRTQIPEDQRDLLTGEGGLLSSEQKRLLSGYFQDKKGNSYISEQLAKKIWRGRKQH